MQEVYKWEKNEDKGGDKGEDKGEDKGGDKSGDADTAIEEDVVFMGSVVTAVKATYTEVAHTKKINHIYREYLVNNY